MKYPKRGFNRIRKSLVPDKPVTVDPVPKKHYPSLGKTSPNDWRRRWFLGAIILALLSGMPILAQDATSAGPVHSPGSQIVIPSNATPATPMAASTSPAPAAAVSGDIHDIRGPISIPYQWLWVAYFVGGVIVAAVIYGAWCALRRRKGCAPHDRGISLRPCPANGFAARAPSPSARGLHGSLRSDEIREMAGISA
jgi:hypothetical protein